MEVHKDTKSVRRTLSITEELDNIVDRQVSAGIAASRTDWFEQAGWMLLMMQNIGLEDLDADAAASADAVPEMSLVVGGDDD